MSSVGADGFATRLVIVNRVRFARPDLFHIENYTRVWDKDADGNEDWQRGVVGVTHLSTCDVERAFGPEVAAWCEYARARWQERNDRMPHLQEAGGRWPPGPWCRVIPGRRPPLILRTGARHDAE